MTSIMRRTVRRSAVTLGAVALALGAAAGGGSSDAESGDSGEDTATTEEAAAEDEATEEDTAAEEDTTAEEDTATEEDSAAEEGDEAATELTEEDLTAAEERFLEFLQVADDGDHEATCGYVLDPNTGEPAEGAFVEGCAEGMAGNMGNVEPGTFDSLSVDDIEAADNGDGTVAITFLGSDFPLDMIQGPDGQWYIDGSM